MIIDNALQELKEGNKRFVNGNSYPYHIKHKEFEEAIKTHNPFVAILTCSDARIPLEIIFDQGFGKIFVIRNAGNIIDQAGLGSLEFAINVLQVGLVVVLGHQNCGAVQATINVNQNSKSEDSNHTNINYITNFITNAFNEASEKSKDHSELIHNTTICNIHNTMRILKTNEFISKKIETKNLEVTSAFYKLSTGEVFFDV